ncbi:MAG: type II toxin-antitoxin system VapC family toxin [Coleofasciculus sp.]|uniref:type II toxin-antitoxin system VapC family toxin n=1 Tax=Coleofasciculus sp. TaxID=3100458 RepID=UPI003A38C2D9
MIAVDTNVVVRLLTQDDELQFNKSVEVFREPAVFIPDTVILETEWVLRFAYKFKPADICKGLRYLLGLSNVYITNDRLMAQVINWHENGLDFADAFHLAQSQDCSGFYTFDDKFCKKAQGLSNCRMNKL